MHFSELDHAGKERLAKADRRKVITPVGSECSKPVTSTHLPRNEILTVLHYTCEVVQNAL